MNSHPLIVFGSTLNHMSWLKYALLTTNTVGVIISWSESTFCYKPIFIANCVLILMFCTQIPQIIKHDIKRYTVFILWAVELTADKKNELHPGCLTADGQFFHIWSIWFFRSCLCSLTLFLVLPMVLQRVCVNTTIGRFFHRQRMLISRCGIRQESINILLPLTKYSRRIDNKQSVSSQDSSALQNDDPCSICLEEFKEDEYVRKVVQCEHLFHSNCIEKWLINHKTCPYCRRLLSNEVVIREEYQPPQRGPEIAGEVGVSIN